MNGHIYSCGHTAEPIIIGNSPLAFIWYHVWRERNKDDLCFRCFLEKEDFPHRADLELKDGVWVRKEDNAKVDSGMPVKR